MCRLLGCTLSCRHAHTIRDQRQRAVAEGRPEESAAIDRAGRSANICRCIHRTGGTACLREALQVAGSYSRPPKLQNYAPAFERCSTPLGRQAVCAAAAEPGSPDSVTLVGPCPMEPFRQFRMSSIWV